MNPGTFYLYEYENNKRRRNVGFIKITRHYRSCILQIHARGIPVGNGASMELYAFYCDSGDLVGTRVADLNCFGRNISARLPISEIRFPEARPLDRIDGFLIRLPGGSAPLFWMASAVFFDVNISRLRPPGETLSEPAPPEDDASEEASPEEISSEETVSAEDSPGETAPAAEKEPVEVPEDEEAAAAQEHSSARQAERTEGSARKIRREDISLLPRRFWPLANNSFLLHGYHNYSHLILIEENGRLWLGVPGIYDPHEARAADLFGFPRFIRSYADCIGLEEEERCDSADFGHWCRCVGPSAK